MKMSAPEESEKAGDHVTDMAANWRPIRVVEVEFIFRNFLVDYELGCCAGTRRWFVVFLLCSN